MAHGLAPTIILLIFPCLFIIIFCTEINKRTKIPLPVLLFPAGILYSLIGFTSSEFEETIEMLETIDPSTINFILLPPLIYEASTNVEWHTFKKELPKIIPLATLLVVICTILNGLAIHYILDYSYRDSFMLGVIFSATDHVAVCAQLKEAHVYKRLETLILGETLLNEATIISGFKIAFDGIQQTDWYHTLFYFKLSFGGVLIGLLCAIILGALLGYIVNDATQEISLTLVGAYLTYYIAEGTYLHCSGALAVVTLGLYMAGKGRTLISPAIENVYHSFWKILGVNVESLVFVFAGFLLRVDEDKNSINWGNSLIIFGVLYVIRWVSLLFLNYSFLIWIGNGIKLREQAFLSFSGTKGAVSLALALSLNDRVMFFYVSSVSALTILFGTFIVKISAKKLGLSGTNESQEAISMKMGEFIVEESKKKMKMLKNNPENWPADWEKVTEIANPLNITKRITKRNLKVKFDKSISYVERQSNVHRNGPDVIRRYMIILKNCYWHLFEEGKCRKKTVVTLIKCANQDIDRIESLDSSELLLCKIDNWKTVQSELSSKRWLKLVQYLSHKTCFKSYFAKYTYKEISMYFDVCNSFIEGNSKAYKTMKKHFPDAVMLEMMNHDEMLKCEHFKEELIQKYTEIYESVVTNSICKELLKFQEELICKMHDKGSIEVLDYNKMKDGLDVNLKKLYRNPIATSMHKIVKKKFPLWNKEVMKAFLRNAEEKHLNLDKSVFDNGDFFKKFYIVLGGMVREFYPYDDFRNIGHGQLLGAHNLFSNLEQYCTSARTLSIVRVAEIDRSFIEEPRIYNQIVEEACVEILLSGDLLTRLNIKKFAYDVVKDCELLKFDVGDQFLNSNGFFVLIGELENLIRKDTKRGVDIVEGDKFVYKARTYCAILKFTGKLGNIIKNEDIDRGLCSYFSKRTARIQDSSPAFSPVALNHIRSEFSP